MMTRKRSALVSAVVMTTLLACSGCAPEQGLDWDTAAKPMWSVDGVAMSEALTFDDTVVTYRYEDNREYVVGYDISDGTEVWRHEASTGYEARAVAHSVPSVQVDGTDSVAFLAPHEASDESGWASMTVVDATSGENLLPGLSDQVVWSRRPYVCDESYCAEATFSGNLRYSTVLHVDFGSEKLTAEPREGEVYAPGGLLIGNNVSVTWDDDDVPTLRYGVDREFVWELPYADVFGEGADTNAGWAWWDDDDGTLIGWGGSVPDRDFSVPHDFSIPLTNGRLVRLDEKTGETLWSHDHVRGCPATGGHYFVADRVAVVCDFSSGAITGHWTGTEGVDIAYTDVDADLVGIDIETGEELWRQSLNDSERNYAYDLDDDHHFASGVDPLVMTDDSLVVIDHVTGEATPVPADATLLCTAWADDVALPSPYAADDDPTGMATHSPADIITPCTPEGELVPDADVTSAALEIAGYDLTEPFTVNLLGKLTYFDAMKPSTAEPDGDSED